MYFHFLLIFLFGLIGGIAAFLIGMPMPFLLGGIVGAAGFVLFYERNGVQLPKMSRWVRIIFASFIGAMVGSRFSPDLLTILPLFWISGLAIIPFILLAHGGNYVIMRKLGGYKKLDAYFAALPGGIVDSVALAEDAKADVKIVTMQHFVRIIIAVSAVPLLFWFIEGNAVGSLGGESLAAVQYEPLDVILLTIIAMTGLFGGRFLGLPVAHLTGSLILALLLSATGMISLDIPVWMPHLAQYMLGVSLGAQFSGLSRNLLVRGLGMGLTSGAYMMLLAATFALILVNFVPAEFGAMFISFAAGGLAEMSLIALSLNFAPVVVALHHLTRIFLTIWIGNQIFKNYFKKAKDV